MKKLMVLLMLTVFLMLFSNHGFAYDDYDYGYIKSKQKHSDYNDFYGVADGNHYIHEPDGSHRKV